MSEFRYLECSCSSPEHTIRFARDEDFLYMTFFLENGSWPRRLLTAIKYVFGHKSNYGHFDEVVLGREEINRLLETLKNEYP
jgi:hypothetical protein